MQIQLTTQIIWLNNDRLCGGLNISRKVGTWTVILQSGKYSFAFTSCLWGRYNFRPRITVCYYVESAAGLWPPAPRFMLLLTECLHACSPYIHTSIQPASQPCMCLLLGQTYRDKQPFTVTFTPKVSLAWPVLPSFKCMSVDFRIKLEDLRENPCRHMENIQPAQKIFQAFRVLYMNLELCNFIRQLSQFSASCLSKRLAQSPICSMQHYNLSLPNGVLSPAVLTKFHQAWQQTSQEVVIYNFSRLGSTTD